jgi:predicted DNA repair protein MutK
MPSGFFALLDDIATLMDDVAVMSKVAAKKTAGILGDDLAVNAEKSSGFVSSREIPVLWAIGKGSLLNKIIILPIAFLLSAFFPFGVILLLIAGGLYLAYEGAEKIFHLFVPHKKEHHKLDERIPTKEEVLSKEKDKIKSAIITDFILSVEIIIITLGTVINEPFLNQIIIVSVIAIIATVGVYGIVALIVRMDDLGLAMISGSSSEKSFKARFGNFLVKSLPWVIKGLSVIGTIALFLVAGGIFVHNISFLHHLLVLWPSLLKEFVIGIGLGFICLLIVNPLKFLIGKLKSDK